jgi:hypothetical protein
VRGWARSKVADPRDWTQGCLSRSRNRKSDPLAPTTTTTTIGG